MPGVHHVRAEIQGTLMDGGEVWSMGFSLPPFTAAVQSSLEDFAPDVRDFFSSDMWSHVDVTPLFGTSTVYTGVRVQQLRPDGTVEGSAESLVDSPHGGTDTFSLPPQCAVVVSLRTSLPGPRGRGRMYLPALGTGQVNHSGRLDSAARDLLATQMATFLNTINLSSTNPGSVGVASGVGMEINAVTSVRVGDVVDTQRRRRDQLAEAYSTYTVTP